MRGTSIAVLTSLAGAVAIGAGCKNEKADTPEQAIVNMHRSVETGDKELFLASVLYEDREIASAFFDMVSECHDAVRRIEKTYGATEPDVLSFVCPGYLPECEDIEGKITVAVDGDTATATLPDRYDPLRLVRKAGSWRVDISEPKYTSQEHDQALRAMRKMTEVARAAKCNVGKPGYTKQDIEGALFMGVMMAAFYEGLQAGAPDGPPAAEVSSGLDKGAPAATTGRPAPNAGGEPRTYVVRRGDNLTKIAEQVYGPKCGHRYRKIYDANRDRLKDPNLLPIGIVLRIPLQ